MLVSDNQIGFNKLKSKGVLAYSVSKYNFSTLYTTRIGFCRIGLYLYK